VKSKIVFCLVGLVSTLAFAQAPRFKHIVMVMQENRSTDNMFGSNPNFEPGVDIASTWINSKGQTVPLTPVPLVTTWDLGHNYRGFVRDYADGKMNGFKTIDHQYVDNSKGIVQPYFDIAEQYAFANRMFQSNRGPSYPAHQFLVSATSSTSDDSDLMVIGNPTPGVGCNASPDSSVQTINPAGEIGKTYPCFDRASIMDLLEPAGLSWRYYSVGSIAGIWDGPNSLPSYYKSPYNILVPAQVLTDVANCDLANVVFVTPTHLESDHAGGNNGTGPAWVASIVNAIGTNPTCSDGDHYWDDTAILITWDDWGGWYDHVLPPSSPKSGWGLPYVYGFRVPLLVVSAYTPAGYVDNVQHDFSSFLRFTETNFNLGLIGPGTFGDSYADDMSTFFTLSKPRIFSVIPAPAVDFMLQPLEDPDDD